VAIKKSGPMIREVWPAEDELGRFNQTGNEVRSDLKKKKSTRKIIIQMNFSR
jgi:hypothetical protein